MYREDKYRPMSLNYVTLTAVLLVLGILATYAQDRTTRDKLTHRKESGC